MKRLSFFSAVVLAVSVFFIAAIAYASDIDRRVAEMHRRIDQGVKSGELTHQEAQRLRLELNKVRNDEAKMKADGRLTGTEKNRLNRELDRLSQHIYREKHDQENVVSDINRRVAEMHRRIDQGVKSRELTHQEAQRLRLELNKVRNDEAKMKADGRLTGTEKNRLNRELDRLSQHIYREKHDQERR